MTTTPPSSATQAPAPAAPQVLHLDRAQDDADPVVGLRRRLTTALALAAPPLLVLGNALMPALPRDPAQAVAAVPAVADRYLAAALMYALASLLHVPFVLALWRVGTRRGAWLRFGGGAVLVLAMVLNALSLVLWGYLLWGSARAGLPDELQVRLGAALDGSAATLPVSFLAVPLAVLGMLALAAGLLRSRVVPHWAVGLWVVGVLASASVGAGPLALVGLVGAAGGAVLVLSTRR
ncbi:hypothetical protein [Cellulomonas marina]|uniref:Uncharacterized protein n=1 Tax=Cellulomonas marina TaxID=988821 RepID=A0A1I1ALC3_9CELL|nr:hypothetical protein [Cellulomonas marina]GIG30193.1 hypothetical protein Cma02nite_27930 [Cellulomonas marina]SFB37123.1 hypothetical protein SAMN05421867_11832 [Cellulomonas marina]